MTGQLEQLHHVLTDQYLEQLAGPVLLQKGRRFFHEGRVMSFSRSLDGYSCKVADEKLYAVEISVFENSVESSCSCGVEPVCVHRIAALFTLQRELPPPAAVRPLPGVIPFFQETFHFVPPSGALKPELEVLLDVKKIRDRQPQYNLTLRLGGKEGVLFNEIHAFLKSWYDRVRFMISEDVIYDPKRWLFSHQHQQMLYYLYHRSEHDSAAGDSRFLILPADTLSPLLEVLSGTRVLLRSGNSDDYRELEVDSSIMQLGYRAQDLDDGGMQIVLEFAYDGQLFAPDKVTVLPVFPVWAVVGNKLVRMSAADAAGLGEALRSYSRVPGSLTVSKEETTFVLQELLPYLERHAPVKLEGRLKKAVKPAKKPPQPVLRIDLAGIAIMVELLFRYGNKRIRWDDKEQLVRTGNYSWIQRLPDVEQQTLDLLTGCGFHTDNDGLYLLENEEAVFRFIYQTLPRFQQEWDILYSKEFRKVAKRLSGPKIGVRFSKKYDFLEVRMFPQDRGITIDPRMVLESAQQGKSYVRLQDGQFLPLNEEQQELLKKLADKIDFIPETRGGQTVLTAEGKFVPVAAETLTELEVQDVETDDTVFERNNDLKSWKKKMPVPSGLQATLRSYQEEGFSWLANIYDNRLGGILADDMGLGKTIQTITMVLHAISCGETRPFLIVCPSSLVFNWVNEAEKFAPELSTLYVNGSPAERIDEYQRIFMYHVVVISYSLLQRDQEELEKIEFAAVFLDEAQHIKNPGSGRTISAKAVKADCRFALTGTPIENSLGELWSLFDFVLPGYLFGYKRFKEEYEKPIMELHQEAALEALKSRIGPYMLRRTKSEVLKQLPPKTEQVCLCPMYEEQRQAYLSVLSFFDSSLLPLLERDGIQSHQIELLAALTRLRQICCHPGLALDSYQEAVSGKMETLFEILNQAIDGGHRTLIFSQFTGMLDVIGERMQQEQISYVRLDGGSSMKHREAAVNRFNEDFSVNAFLISLKAGGTGLNLTTADTVIHVDPWWNPAAEDQASARAYRMGQKNPVNVYKLIAEKSVEEKILALQGDKKRLFEAVVEDQKVDFKKLSLDQIRDLFRA